MDQHRNIPLIEYLCTACGEKEVRPGVTDDPCCKQCGGKLMSIGPAGAKQNTERKEKYGNT